MSAVQRFGMVIKMRPEGRDRYVEMHANPPQHLLDNLKSRNIRNYSIFLRGDLLFSYLEYTGDDFRADMSRPYPPGQEWLDEVMPLQEPLPDRRPGEWWASMDEVFHLD